MKKLRNLVRDAMIAICKVIAPFPPVAVKGLDMSNQETREPANEKVIADCKAAEKIEILLAEMTDPGCLFEIADSVEARIKALGNPALVELEKLSAAIDIESPGFSELLGQMFPTLLGKRTY